MDRGALRRLAGLVALGLVPWTVLLVGDRATLVFAFGFLDADSLHLVWLPELLARGGGLPRNPELLPLGVLFYGAALASAAGGAAGREDPRLTGGLLALAGVTHLGVAYSVLHRAAYTPLPLGTLLLVGSGLWYWRRYYTAQ